MVIIALSIWLIINFYVIYYFPWKAFEQELVRTNAQFNAIGQLPLPAKIYVGFSLFFLGVFLFPSLVMDQYSRWRTKRKLNKVIKSIKALNVDALPKDTSLFEDLASLEKTIEEDNLP